jgi:hypothetical protein
MKNVRARGTARRMRLNRLRLNLPDRRSNRDQTPLEAR